MSGEGSTSFPFWVGQHTMAAFTSVLLYKCSHNWKCPPSAYTAMGTPVCSITQVLVSRSAWLARLDTQKEYKNGAILLPQ